MNDKITDLMIEKAIKEALANIMFEEDYVLTNVDEITNELVDNNKMLIKKNGVN